MTDSRIIVPTGRGPRLQRRRVLPSGVDLPMNCGVCSSKHFRLHVRPIDGTGQITEAVCVDCKRVYKFDDSGRLERGGKVNPTGGTRQ